MKVYGLYKRTKGRPKLIEASLSESSLFDLAWGLEGLDVCLMPLRWNATVKRKMNDRGYIVRQLVEI